MSQPVTATAASPLATPQPVDVALRDITKFYNGEPAVAGINLEIQRGEFFSILGPSGCGKTTTLRLIGGFEQPSQGDVFIRGENMSHTPPYRRPVNTVFQSYALFGHMTVAENVAFGLKVKNCPAPEREDRVRHALHLVQMERMTSRYPNQLSGGQQQRVALARALVNRPAVLLLDEPLGALDLKLRKEMQMELSTLHRELGLTFVMVTHDQEEALSLSDRIAVMNHGYVEQVGTPRSIYDRPQTPFVADFIGDTNLLQGKAKLEKSSTSAIVNTEKGLCIVVESNAEPLPTLASDSAVMLSIRPEKISLNLKPVDAVNCFQGTLQQVMYLGTHQQYVVQLFSGDHLVVRQSEGGGSLAPSTPVYVSWHPQDGLMLAASAA
ncbi:MAG: ABC transporter ATP-binding protein [Prochlorotrichaceae cyanobacterium]|jgi:spermidine/putrescine transport system ATP-binding protein